MYSDTYTLALNPLLFIVYGNAFCRDSLVSAAAGKSAGCLLHPPAASGQSSPRER